MAKDQKQDFIRPLHEVVGMVDEIINIQIFQGDKCAVPYLQGKPGGGKTESIRSLAKSNDDEFIACHFAMMNLEDFSGIPDFDEVIINQTVVKTTAWSYPELISLCQKKHDITEVKSRGGIFIINKNTKEKRCGIKNISKEDFLNSEENLKMYKFKADLEDIEEIAGDNKDRRVILLLDDMHRCGPPHMTALFEFLTERSLKNYKIPDNVGIILAGNTSQKAGAQAMLSAIVNRCILMQVGTDFTYWKNNYAIKNKVHSAVISFLQQDSNIGLFHDEEEVNSPWASPRAWTNFSRVLTRFEEKLGNKFSTSDLEYLIYGHLGQDASQKFIQYYKIFTQFPCDEIFETVKTAKDFMKYIDKYKLHEHYSLAYACINKYFSVPAKERTKKKYNNVIINIIEAYHNNKSGKSLSEIGITILKEMQLITTALGKHREIQSILSAISALKDENNKSILTSALDSIVDVNSVKVG